MKKVKVNVTDAAIQDLKEAGDWLGQDAESKAKKFLEDYYKTEDTIALTPEGFPKYYKDFRKAGMQKFPYSVYYEPDMQKEEATVAAVVHQARSRRTILGKLKREK